jgi:hypothetical protein
MRQILKLTVLFCLTTTLSAACGDDDDEGTPRAGTGGSSSGRGGSGGSAAGSGGSTAGSGGSTAGSGGSTAGSGGSTAGSGGSTAGSGGSTAGSGGSDVDGSVDATVDASSDGGCTSGQTRACTCADGGTGTETCQGDGGFGACSCGAAPGDAGDGGLGPFARCTSPNGCGSGLTCLRPGTNGVPSPQTPGYCTATNCRDGGAACPQPTTGTVQAICSTLADICILQCAAPDAGDGGTCPAGMECQTVPGIGPRRCVYPARLAQRYEECGGGVQCAQGLQCVGALSQCGDPCGDGGAACPAPASGIARPICQQAGPGAGVCVLECSENTDCPLGMTCRTQGGGQRCSY